MQISLLIAQPTRLRGSISIRIRADRRATRSHARERLQRKTAGDCRCTNVSRGRVFQRRWPWRRSGDDDLVYGTDYDDNGVEATNGHRLNIDNRGRSNRYVDERDGYDRRNDRSDHVAPPDAARGRTDPTDTQPRASSCAADTDDRRLLDCSVTASARCVEGPPWGAIEASLAGDAA